MASAALDKLTPDTRERAEAFLAAAKAAGFDLILGSTLRTCAEQGTNVGPFDVQGMKLKRAAGCRSWHVWGRAFDVLLKDPSDARYAELGKVGKSVGLEWGGDFATNYDPIHFQYHPGLDITKLCPDPMDCEGALARAGLPVPGSGSQPTPTKSKPELLIAFAGGAIAGWLGAGLLNRIR